MDLQLYAVVADALQRGAPEQDIEALARHYGLSYTRIKAIQAMLTRRQQEAASRSRRRVSFQPQAHYPAATDDAADQPLPLTHPYGLSLHPNT